LKNKQCYANNNCQFRHIMFDNDKQKANNNNQKKSLITLIILKNLFVEYHKQSKKIQFNVSWHTFINNERKKYEFKNQSPHKLLNYLTRNNSYQLIADIGLFADKTRSFSIKKWKEWFKQQSINNNLSSLKDEQQSKIISKIRALLIHYNVNYRYNAKTLNPIIYYRLKIVVNGFINIILKENEFCPDEIVTLIFGYYHTLPPNQLFDHTSTVKISTDTTIIHSDRRLINSDNVSLPFIVYKNKSFKLIKIKCLSIPNNLLFSIGIINDLDYLNKVKTLKNSEFWPFNMNNNGKDRPKQFYFGCENDDRRSINDDDIYCGVLRTGDIITFCTKFKVIKERERKSSWTNGYRKQPIKYYNKHRKEPIKISLCVHSKSTPRYREYECPPFDGYPSFAFDFISTQETKFEILDIE